MIGFFVLSVAAGACSETSITFSDMLWGVSPQKKSKMEKFFIHQRHMGLVLGKGGTTIKEIRERFNVQINIGEFEFCCGWFFFGFELICILYGRE